MTDYEIRIVRNDDKSQIVITARLMGNHAAVRRAEMLASPGDLVEVWSGSTCIYSNISDYAL